MDGPHGKAPDRPAPGFPPREERVSGKYRRSIEREKAEEQRFRELVGWASGHPRPRGEAVLALPLAGLCLGALPATLILENRSGTSIVLWSIVHLSIAIIVGGGAGAWFGAENRKAGLVSGAVSMPLAAFVGCLLWLGEPPGLAVLLLASAASAGGATILYQYLRKRL